MTQNFITWFSCWFRYLNKFLTAIAVEISKHIHHWPCLFFAPPYPVSHWAKWRWVRNLKLANIWLWPQMYTTESYKCYFYGFIFGYRGQNCSLTKAGKQTKFSPNDSKTICMTILDKSILPLLEIRVIKVIKNFAFILLWHLSSALKGTLSTVRFK